MQKLIFKSEKTNEELELTFGLLMSTSKLPADQQVLFLLKQSSTNAAAITAHYQKNVDDKLTYVKTVFLD
ncbi:hypothetical protein KAZ57_01110 [Patescibacteria group bacterium]|nr:hypothetical protein [Patescibacteria group bacterium]